MCCLCVYVFARVYISAFKNVALGLKRLLAERCICLRIHKHEGAVCGCLCMSVWDSVSERVLTAVRIHAPLQLHQLDPEDLPPPAPLLPASSLQPPGLVPLRLLPATRGQCIYPATHCSPINPIICLFFQDSPGQSLRGCRLSSMGAWQRKNLWRAAVNCCLTRCLTSLLQLFRVPMVCCHPHPPFNYHFEMK